MPEPALPAWILAKIRTWLHGVHSLVGKSEQEYKWFWVSVKRGMHEICGGIENKSHWLDSTDTLNLNKSQSNNE